MCVSRSLLLSRDLGKHLRSRLTYQTTLRISPINTFPLQYIQVYFGLWFSLLRLFQVRVYDVQRYLCYLEKEAVFQRLVCTFPHGTATKQATLDSVFCSFRNYFRSECNPVSCRKKSQGFREKGHFGFKLCPILMLVRALGPLAS